MEISTTEIKELIKQAIKLDKEGSPKQAIKTNLLAIKLLKKIIKVLEDNNAIFEMHDFLKGDSSITRPKK